MKLSRKARTKGPDYVPAEPKPRRDPGRPTAYDEAVTFATACDLAEKGHTDQEIAAGLGIGVSTLYRYYANRPEFREAVNRSKATADERVKQSLYKRATGYEQVVEKVFANGTRIKVTEAVQPDTTAQIFWLKNRDRQNWRDTREVDLVVPMQDGQTEEHNSSDRQLAMAALALFHEVDAEPAGPVIEGEINEESEDEIEDVARREEGPSEVASYDKDPGEVDLDFDRD